MFCPERAVKFEVFVGGSSDCKLVVFVFMHVGGTDELQPGGPFLRLSCRWILPTDCRRPPLSLSWSGSPKGNSEWSKSLARTYAVSFSFASSIANALRHKKVLGTVMWLPCPSSEEFVLHKLKKDAAEEGVFLVRWSAVDYHSIILAVLKRNEVTRRPLSSFGNVCTRLKSFRRSMLTCVCAHRTVRHQATSSSVSSRRVRCFAWRAGTESSPVWRSSSITSKPLC